MGRERPNKLHFTRTPETVCRQLRHGDHSCIHMEPPEAPQRPKANTFLATFHRSCWFILNRKKVSSITTTLPSVCLLMQMNFMRQPECDAPKCSLNRCLLTDLNGPVRIVSTSTPSSVDAFMHKTLNILTTTYDTIKGEPLQVNKAHMTLPCRFSISSPCLSSTNLTSFQCMFSRQAESFKKRSRHIHPIKSRYLHAAHTHRPYSHKSLRGNTNRDVLECKTHQASLTGYKPWVLQMCPSTQSFVHQTTKQKNKQHKVVVTLHQARLTFPSREVPPECHEIPSSNHNKPTTWSSHKHNSKLATIRRPQRLHLQTTSRTPWQSSMIPPLRTPGPHLEVVPPNPNIMQKQKKGTLAPSANVSSSPIPQQDRSPSPPPLRLQPKPAPPSSQVVPSDMSHESKPRTAGAPQRAQQHQTPRFP